MKALIPYILVFLVKVFYTAAGREPEFILVTTATDVEAISVTTGRQTSLVGSLFNAITVDYDYAKNQIFFNEEDRNQIYVVKSNISATNDPFTTTSPEVILNYTNLADGIAYDWVHKVLYWTDAGKDTIELLTMKRRQHLTIIDTNLYSPKGIAVDPRDDQKWVYWTDWFKKPRIEKAGLDGSHRTLVVATNLGWPNYLAIDFADNRLFWTDEKLDSISSSDLNGQNVRVVLSDARFTRNPYSIDILGDMVYWDAWQNNEIYEANKYNGSLNVRTIAHTTRNTLGLRMYHRSRQPKGSDPCGVHNGGCSHICLAAPVIGSSTNKFSCLCPDTGC